MFLGDADFESAKKSDLKKFKMDRSSEKKIIEAQAELIKNLQKQIKEWEERKGKKRWEKAREKDKKPKSKKSKK